MSFWDSIFAPGETERGAALDAANNARTQQLYEKGLITEKQRDFAIQDVNSTGSDNYARQIAEDFSAGAQSGYDSMVGAAKETLAAPFKVAWDVIPWQLYVAGGLALFWWMGGAALHHGLTLAVGAVPGVGLRSAMAGSPRHEPTRSRSAPPVMVSSRRMAVGASLRPIRGLARALVPVATWGGRQARG